MPSVTQDTDASLIDGGQKLTTAPLFASRLAPGETCWAQHVWHVKVAMLVRAEDGTVEKRWLKKDDLPLRIIAAETTEQDFVDAFDDGNYWVEAVRSCDEGKGKVRGSIMPGGHVIRVGDAEESEEDEREEEEARRRMDPRFNPAFAAAANGAQNDTVKAAIGTVEKASSMVIDVMKEQVKAAQAQTGNPMAMLKDVVSATAMLRPGEDTAQIRGILAQMEEAQRRHRAEVEELNRTHREERARLDKQIEDIRREERERATRAERDTDEKIRDMRDELKTRETRADEERRRLLAELDDVRKSHRSELQRIDDEFSSYRRGHEAQAGQAQLDSLKLSKDLVESQGMVNLNKLELDRLRKENERLERELDREKREHEDTSEELDQTETKLREAESKAKSSEDKLPIDGMIGWAINKFGPSAMEMFAKFAAAQAEQQQQQQGELPAQARPQIRPRPAQQPAQSQPVARTTPPVQQYKSPPPHTNDSKAVSLDDEDDGQVFEPAPSPKAEEIVQAPNGKAASGG